MAVKHRRYHRRRNPKGQLQPLSARLSAHQAVMREERRQWRSGLAQHMGMMNFTLQQFLRRGFFGRLRWLVTGQ